MNIIKKKYYLIPLIICLLGLTALTFVFFLGSFSKSDETEYVFIDDDDDLDSVCVKLKPIGSEQTISAFRILSKYWRYTDHIRSGRYAITPDESTTTVFRHLKNGHQSPVRLTIPESRTMERLAGALSRKLMLDSMTLVTSLQDSAFCAHLGYDTATIACLFVPDTYEIYWNTPLDLLMERLRKEHDHFWNGQRVAKATSLGLTENEVCTLASIIDEETANNGEKPMIAGMYLNRLKKGMPLQADPTVKFALKDFALRRIYHDMLNYNSPYNTYKNTGLPPGPIKIASVAGSDAVLSRGEHDYLYRCAKEDFSGTHNFASNYQDHLKNAARYAQALNDRGIK